MKSQSKHDAVVSLAKDIQERFKKLPKNYRKDVWNAITSSKGEKLIDKLIEKPESQIINWFRTLSFKEWLETTNNQEDKPADQTLLKKGQRVRVKGYNYPLEVHDTKGDDVTVRKGTFFLHTKLSQIEKE